MKTVVKRIYEVAAMLALLNTMAFVSVVGFLVGTGRLDQTRARAALEALRRSPDVSDVPVEGIEGGAQSQRQPIPAQTTSATPEEQQIAWRTAERYRTELEQRRIAVNAAMTKVTTQRELLQKRLEAEREQRRRQSEELEENGFRQELELLSSLKPDMAKEALLQKDTADAARFLLELDTRTAKRVVEAAFKSPRQKEKILEVLKLLPEMQLESKGDLSGLTGA